MMATVPASSWHLDVSHYQTNKQGIVKSKRFRHARLMAGHGHCRRGAWSSHTPDIVASPDHRFWSFDGLRSSLREERARLMSRGILVSHARWNAKFASIHQLYRSRVLDTDDVVDRCITASRIIAGAYLEAFLSTTVTLQRRLWRKRSRLGHVLRRLFLLPRWSMTSP